MRKQSIFSLATMRRQARRLAAAQPTVWDVGSSTTRVWVGQKLVFADATCLLINERTNAVLALGSAAYRLLGTIGKPVKIVFPVSAGAITDDYWAQVWLERVRLSLWPRRRWLLPFQAPRGVLALPAAAGTADVQVWEAILHRAGLNAVQPIRSFAGLTAFLNGQDAEQLCFALDIGATQSQLGILLGQEVLFSASLSFGGVDLTTAVQQWLFEQQRCQVSWLQAEMIKRKVVSLSTTSRTKKTSAKGQELVIRGKDPYTQLGMTITVFPAQLSQVTTGWADNLMLMIKQFLASLPAEVATQSLEQGLWLIGGGAQLPGLTAWLGEQLAAPVQLVREPSEALAKGLMIISIDRLEGRGLRGNHPS